MAKRIKKKKAATRKKTVPRRTKAGLSEKNKQFCREYVIDLNGTQAAIRAGYSEKTAGSQANRLLKNAEIKKYIAELQQKRVDKLEISADRVLKEAARLAYFDIRKLYDDKNRLLNIRDLDDDTAAALAAVDVDELFEGRGEDRELIGYSRKVKTFNKVSSVELLMRHLNLLVDRHEHTGKDGGPIVVQELSKATAKAEDIVNEAYGKDKK